MSVLRLSPLHDRLLELQPVWGTHNDMPVALRVAPSGQSIELCDLSVLNRMGLKGPGAAEWLESNAIPVPLRPNSWTPLSNGGLIARLGRTEFLVEDAWQGDIASALRAKLGTGTVGVYPVLRQDAAMSLRGPCVQELLAQTCNIYFNCITPQERAATLTMMVGVAVTIIDASLDDNVCYRIWCDGTYGIYLWDTLLAIAVQVAGCAVGMSSIYPEASATQPVAV
jgi:sarcosine oxidase, subunit gamma